MLTSATAPTIAAVDIPEGGEGRAVSVEWSTGEHISYNVLWLRDNCPTGGDKRSAFRTFSVADLDPDLRVDAAHAADDSLYVEFSDGHLSTLSTEWLADHGLRKVAANPASTWRGDAELPTFAFERVMTDDGWLDLLDTVTTFGVATVADTPTDDGGSEALAARLGSVRVTDFGRFFDIVSEPDVWTMSQSTSAMDRPRLIPASGQDDVVGVQRRSQPRARRR